MDYDAYQPSLAVYNQPTDMNATSSPSGHNMFYTARHKLPYSVPWEWHWVIILLPIIFVLVIVVLYLYVVTFMMMHKRKIESLFNDLDISQTPHRGYKKGNKPVASDDVKKAMKQILETK